MRPTLSIIPRRSHFCLYRRSSQQRHACVLLQFDAILNIMKESRVGQSDRTFSKFWLRRLSKASLLVNLFILLTYASARFLPGNYRFTIGDSVTDLAAAISVLSAVWALGRPKNNAPTWHAPPMRRSSSPSPHSSPPAAASILHLPASGSW